MPRSLNKFFWFFLFPAFLILAITPPRISGYLNPYDEGLWLGAAQAVLAGKAIYREVFFHYGLFLAWYLQAALKFLPHTVGALRGSFWVLNTAALLVIYYALLHWVRQSYLRLGYAVILFCVPLSAHVPTIPMAGRYAAGFLPILFWPYADEKPARGRLKSFLAGLATIAALFISQEVGVAALLANLYVFVWGTKEKLWRPFLMGLATGILPLLVWLGLTHTLLAYLNCTWLQTTAIVVKDKLPMPRLSIPEDIPWFIAWQVRADSFAIYLPALLYAAAWIGVWSGFFKTWKDRKVLTGLLVYGTAAAVSAWVRSDRWHIYFALSPALFLGAVLVDRWPSAKKELAMLIALALGVFLTFPHARMRIYKDRYFDDWSRQTTIPRMGSAHLPLIQADGYEFLVGWIQTHVQPGALFLFFPYDGCIYFLADRDNPTFYPVLALANTPSMQARVVQNLEAAPPQWLVWDTENNAFDGTRIDVLLRPIYTFILQHYEVREKAGSFLFMTRKSI